MTRRWRRRYARMLSLAYWRVTFLGATIIAGALLSVAAMISMARFDL